MEWMIVCLIAGLGAGLGTGFAGMSAAAVISPMLITFLGMNSFEAIGIALVSDVLASAVSAHTYGKHKNIDVKNSLPLFVSVLCFTLIGAFVAYYVPNTMMGNLSVCSAFLMGLNFLYKSCRAKQSSKAFHFEGRTRTVVAILCGAGIGWVCGFIGAGGGIMMLILLTGVLGYELKQAVGTSVFIMTFTALFGASSHFILAGSLPEMKILLLCVLSTLVFARIGAKIANVAKPKTLQRTIGIILTVLGGGMMIVNFL